MANQTDDIEQRFPREALASCTVHRCSRQPEMYLYLRSGLAPSDLPPALLAQAGKLEQVMELQLSPARRLARVDVSTVIARLRDTGWFLQLPPSGAMHGHLDDGD